MSHPDITVTLTTSWHNTSWRTWCFWHHLLAKISKLGLQDHDAFQGVSANTAQRYIPGETIWRRCSYYEQTLLCTAYVWRHIRWRWRITCLGEQSPIFIGTGFSPDWWSPINWAYCHSWYKPIWASLHYMPIPCPNKISLVAEVCTTWLCTLLWAKLLKTSSMTPTFNYKSRWGILLRSMQRWWVTSQVSSIRAQVTRCKEICTSHHQRSTCGLRQLDTAKEMQSPWGCPNSAICVGTTMQAWSHNEQKQVTQGQIEPPWWWASLENKLFWDTCTHCDMVCHKTDYHLWHHFLLTLLTNKLCYCISSSLN